MRMKGWLALVVGTAFVAVPALVAADDRDGKQQNGVQWQQLTPAQQDVLEPMREYWDKLPPGKQQALTRGAELTLPPSRRMVRRGAG